jgi:hypothetical protein
MEISVSVTLASDETFGHTADDGAGLVLEALGGDPATDSCHLSIQQAAVGLAGLAADTSE